MGVTIGSLLIIMLAVCDMGIVPCWFLKKKIKSAALQKHFIPIHVAEVAMVLLNA